MPPTKADFDALVAAIDAETTRIGQKILDLLAKIAAGGMSPEEEQAALDSIAAAAERLKLVGADVDNPIPPPEPPVEPPVEASSRR